MTVTASSDVPATASDPADAVPADVAVAGVDRDDLTGPLITGPTNRCTPACERPNRTGSHPLLRVTPSARLAWRGPDQLQLELGARSVVITGTAAEAVARLPNDLERAPRESEAATRTTGCGVAAHPVLNALVRAGFLTGQAPGAEPGGGSDTGHRGAHAEQDHAPGGSSPVRDASATTALLEPDLAALGGRFGGRAHRVMAARRTWRVTVHGKGRLPTLVASLFAAAGIGHVNVTEGFDVLLRDAIPGGLRPADEGRRQADAAHDAVRRVAPGVDTSVSDSPAGDLTVLVTDGPVRPSVHRALLAAGRAHLAAGVWGAHAVVGPLVVPGSTSCLGCADLHRRDRDAVWPALAAQFATSRSGRAPSEVAVCVMAAALTVVQGLAYLDGEEPATADGTLEMMLPDWRLRRRTWRPHPDCPCTRRPDPRHTGRCD